MHGITNAYTLNFQSIVIIHIVLFCPHTIQNYFLLQSKLFSLGRIENKKIKNESLGKTLIQMI